MDTYTRPAVVIGACVHGLAIIRSLGKSNIDVYAVEANDQIPGIKTKYAKKIIVTDINGPGLIDALIDISIQINQSGKPVLFLSNDNMVKTIGENWAKLQDHYELSWEESINTVLELLSKNNIEKYSNRKMLNYPKSWSLMELNDGDRIDSNEYPVIIKPVRPLSSFKTLIAKSEDELTLIVKKFKDDLPLIAQNFILGGDEDIYFCALYLKKGEVLSRFTGQKILSFPPAMGQTLVAVPSDNHKIFELTYKFFEGLNISGPVSLELKKDKHGNYWIIEPTVGRTDFWVDLPIQCGVDLALDEYRSTLNLSKIEKEITNNKIWMDTEKDVLAYLRLVIKQRTLKPYGKKVVFQYYGFNDLSPLFQAIKTRMILTTIKTINKIVKK